MKNELNLMKRDGTWILQRSFKGVGQKQVRLSKDKKTAEARAKIFLGLAESDGFQVALDNLKGKEVVKKGEEIGYDQIKSLYADYLAQCDDTPREKTVKNSLCVLKRILNGKPLHKLDIDELRTRFIPDQKNDSNRRSFASNIRHASAIFKPSAIRYYEKRGFKIENPFINLELKNPSIQPFQPWSKAVLDSVWNDSLTELPPVEALIVNLCLIMALRPSEAIALKFANCSIQADKVNVHFEKTKTGRDRIIPISLEMFERLNNLRNRALPENPACPYFIPFDERNGMRKLARPCARVNAWLQSKGVTDRLPTYGLRKMGGSLICARTSLLEASRILGHAKITTTATHYCGVIEPKTIGGIDAAPENTLEAAARMLGMSLQELLAKVA